VASVRIGLSLLPPDEIRWLATSGIIETSEPVRARIVLLTRSMSLATSADNDSISRSDDFSSSGMTMPTGFPLPEPQAATIRSARNGGKAGALFAPSKEPRVLDELVRTNDIVLISVIEALLTQAHVSYFVADQHMSAVEGSLGFLPRRILVDSDQRERARQLLSDAGLAAELRDA